MANISVDKKYITYKTNLEAITDKVNEIKKLLLQDTIEDDDTVVNTAIESYQYKRKIQELLEVVLDLALTDKEVNKTSLRLFGYSIYKLFGYSVRLTDEEQQKELEEMKKELAQLIWDFSDQEISSELQSAYDNIDAALRHNKGFNYNE